MGQSLESEIAIEVAQLLHSLSAKPSDEFEVEPLESVGDIYLVRWYLPTTVHPAFPLPLVYYRHHKKLAWLFTEQDIAQFLTEEEFVLNQGNLPFFLNLFTKCMHLYQVIEKDDDLQRRGLSPEQLADLAGIAEVGSPRFVETKGVRVFTFWTVSLRGDIDEWILSQIGTITKLERRFLKEGIASPRRLE